MSQLQIPQNPKCH